jgi:Hemerythrin HHE cation binding domain
VVPFGISARRMRDVHEELRDDLARLRMLTDALWNAQVSASAAEDLGDRAGDLAAFCTGYCEFLQRQQGFARTRLFPGVRAASPDLAAFVDAVRPELDRIGDQTVRVRAAGTALSAADADATADLRRRLTGLSALLEDHLSRVEGRLLPLLDEED